MRERFIIVPYDPDWPRRFEDERSLLFAVFAGTELAGYEYVQDYEDQIPERRYFRKPRFGPRAFHVHCVIEAGDLWVRHLALRDYLRARPDVAGEYEDVKRRLASQVTKQDYPEAKSPFIERVLAAAERERDRGLRAAQHRPEPDSR